MRTYEGLIAMLARPHVASPTRCYQVGILVVVLVVIQVVNLHGFWDVGLSASASLAGVEVPQEDTPLCSSGEPGAIRERTGAASPPVVVWARVCAGDARGSFGGVATPEKRVQCTGLRVAPIGGCDAFQCLGRMLPPASALVDAAMVGNSCSSAPRDRLFGQRDAPPWSDSTHPARPGLDALVPWREARCGSKRREDQRAVWVVAVGVPRRLHPLVDRRDSFSASARARDHWKTLDGGKFLRPRAGSSFAAAPPLFIESHIAILSGVCA